MEVTFTGSWYDETAEKEGAQKLIDDGCVLLSQHADSMGAPTACETAGVYDVSYNGSTASACPNTFLVSSKINWSPYFEYCITAISNGDDFATDYIGTIATGSVELTDLGTAVAPGTEEKLNEVKAAIESGDLHVFDITTFTVGGEELSTYMADVDSDAAYEGDHEVIVDGYFNESGVAFRSAPYFDVRIDGITLLDEQY
jgi:basic membrane protein A